MNIESSMLKFQHYEKPLKAISNYKVDELENIAVKLNIDMSKKYKKQELYMEIAKICISYFNFISWKCLFEHNFLYIIFIELFWNKLNYSELYRFRFLQKNLCLR